MIKLLVKSRLLGTFSSLLNKAEGKKKTSKGKIALFAALFAYLFVALIAMSSGAAYFIGSSLIPAGFSWLYFSIFILASLSVIFIFSIFETKAELFDCKDNDLLLSMPIPERAIVSSRLIVVLIYNYFVEALITLPITVVYAIIAKEIKGVIGMLLVSLFIPLIATALASGVGYLVSVISKRVRRKNVVTLILSLLFLGAYFWGYNKLISGMEAFVTGFDPENLPTNLKLLEIIGKSALLSPFSLVSVIAFSLGVSFVAYLIISKNYLKIATDNKGLKKLEYKAKRYEKSSALSALVKKEISRFLSSATYMLNAGIGLLFSIGLAVYAIFKRDMLSELALALLGTGEVVAPILAAGLVFMLSTSFISASALSLEGKSFWILKSLPVSDNTALLSKSLPHIIIASPFIIVSGILLSIASSSPFYYAPFIILIPLIANAAFAFSGLIFNVLAPKFDFSSEAQVIKQSLASLLAMLSSMVIALMNAAIVILSVIYLNTVLAVLFSFLFVSLLTVVFAVILFTICKEKYAKL